jgi:peptidoglycan endopeptidase LytE
MPNVDLVIENNARAVALKKAMLEVAGSWKGTPYLWGGNSKQGIDCSHFVYQVINEARTKASIDGFVPQVVDYRSTSTIEAQNVFIRAAIAQSCDLVMWDGHVAIVIEPGSGSFIGAQNDGVGESNYITNSYWKNRGVTGFFRFAYLF